MALSIYWTKRTWSWIQYPSSKDSSERERIFCCRLFASYQERECGWAFSRRSRAEMAKKGTEEVCCKCRDVVLLLCERYRCRRRRRILSTLSCPNWDNCRCTKCSQHVAWEKSQASINPRGRGGGGVWPTWSWWHIFYRNEDKDLAECSYAKKGFGLDRFRRRSSLISFECKL